MQKHIMILAKTAQQTTGVQNVNQCDKQLACLIMSEQNLSSVEIFLQGFYLPKHDQLRS